MVLILKHFHITCYIESLLARTLFFYYLFSNVIYFTTIKKQVRITYTNPARWHWCLCGRKRSTQRKPTCLTWWPHDNLTFDASYWTLFNRYVSDWSRKKSSLWTLNSAFYCVRGCFTLQMLPYLYTMTMCKSQSLFLKTTPESLIFTRQFRKD